MLRVLSFLVLAFAAGTTRGHGHSGAGCKVIAECNNNVQWKTWPEWSEQAPGLPMPEESPGPKLHYYSNTMTWASGKSFCHAFGQRLCRKNELCTNDSATSSRFLFDVIPGDNWVPIADSFNDWVEIGDSSRRTCYRHRYRYGPPPWGISNVQKPYKGYIYCCPGDSQEMTMRYQFIGKTANYEKSKHHCESQGFRLCNISEVCPSENTPAFGTLRGDMWVAVHDKPNEWVEVGNSHGRTCWVHGPRYGPPTWGTRDDGSEQEWTGYVYCCST